MTRILHSQPAERILASNLPQTEIVLNATILQSANPEPPREAPQRGEGEKENIRGCREVRCDLNNNISNVATKQQAGNPR